MSVGLMLVTHGRLGVELLSTAQNMLGVCPLQADTLSVSQHDDVDELDALAEVIRLRLDDGDGVLVLTDMYGSTPSNVATRLLRRPGVAVIAGVNLPMLIRVMNYPTLPLPELVDKALSGGHTGIVHCQPEDAA